ncbi:adenosylcobinamide-phosphate synthase CbiB [Pseudalkalibacillus decolorationis]|uniref:adenosylcobinamide-phosphate synthase CbiB n=1 Tax=Pseudalkalibacillus decolorationis TaxID=163879 RepID=UPI002148A232|nr:adenosylcobinamide-phosphate synthase CbiB [Pseudalkalibacillus decolorationis]
MIIHHLFSLTLAYAIDFIVGDPPNWPHPVRWIGNLIAILERKWNKGPFRKQKGIGMLLYILLLVGGIVSLIVWGSYSVHPLLGILVEGMIIATTIAQKSLKTAALEVFMPLQSGDIREARKKLSYIVGRDTEQLNEAEITRGTVETVAENTSDGITAPLFWALFGGAPFAVIYRAINTCDSMVGYRNEKYEEFGWASAKLDDLVNWLPSRLTGFLMFFCKKPIQLSRRAAWGTLFRDAKKHPSPNSGWGEAAVAVLLGIQLGGINYYNGVISNRAKMGEPIVPLQRNHILHAIMIMARSAFLFILALWIGGFLIELAITWFQSQLYL